MPLYASMRPVQKPPLDSEKPQTGLRSAIQGKLNTSAHKTKTYNVLTVSTVSKQWTVFVEQILSVEFSFVL